MIIYVVEAHPAGSISPYSNREWTAENSKDSQGNPIEQPADFVQRVDLADLCASEDNITSTILIDDMQNSVWDTYGPAPNLAYFIGSDRKVIEAQHWYEMEKMDKVISSYLQASG